VERLHVRSSDDVGGLRADHGALPVLLLHDARRTAHAHSPHLFHLQEIAQDVKFREKGINCRRNCQFNVCGCAEVHGTYYVSQYDLVSSVSDCTCIILLMGFVR